MNELETRDKYVNILASASTTDGHELLLDCLTYYGVGGIRDLTAEQVKAYCRKKGLVG